MSCRDQFGLRLRSLRERRGLSLDQMASRSVISKAYLWKLEKQPNPNPTIATLEKLAGALDASTGKVPLALSLVPTKADLMKELLG